MPDYPLGMSTDIEILVSIEGDALSVVTEVGRLRHGARKGIAMLEVQNKRQILTRGTSKSWKIDYASHQVSVALEKGGVYANIAI